MIAPAWATSSILRSRIKPFGWGSPYGHGFNPDPDLGPGQSSRNPRKCFRPDVAASLLPGGFSHGHGGVRGRPNNTVRSTSISRFTLTSPSAPLSWFSLSSVGSGHHQVDHGVARGRYPRSDFRRTGRRRSEASYFPESSSVSDSGVADVPQLSALTSSDEGAKRRCDAEAS